jgi:hypothetical protein
MIHTTKPSHDSRLTIRRGPKTADVLGTTTSGYVHSTTRAGPIMDVAVRNIEDWSKITICKGSQSCKRFGKAGENCFRQESCRNER